MAELTPKCLRLRYLHHRRRPYKITQYINTINSRYPIKIKFIYCCLASNQNQYYYSRTNSSPKLAIVTHSSPHKTSLRNKRSLLRHDLRLTVFSTHNNGNPALNAISLKSTSTQSNAVYGLTSLTNLLLLSRNEPRKTLTLAQLAKLLALVAFCAQKQELKFINFKPAQANLFVFTYTFASDQPQKCINIASHYTRQHTSSKQQPQYKKDRLSPPKISRSRDTEEATSSLPASWVTHTYVLYSVRSVYVYIYYVPATRSQQQRLPGGLTLTSSGQPTFGPGFTPWGTDWSITVLPASATLRRIHSHAMSGPPEKSFFVMFILGSFFLRNALYDIYCLPSIISSLVTPKSNFHGSALSQSVPYALTTIFAHPVLRFLAPAKNKHLLRRQLTAHVGSLPKQTSHSSLLYKQVTLVLFNQSNFYYAMTTPTPGTAVTLSSSDDSSSTSSSDSDTEDGNDQNRPPDTPASLSPPPPTARSFPPHNWYTPKKITLPAQCKYPVERNSDDPRKRRQDIRPRLPLVQTPRNIPLARINPLPSDPRNAANKPIHRPSMERRNNKPKTAPRKPPPPRKSPILCLKIL